MVLYRITFYFNSNLVFFYSHSLGSKLTNTCALALTYYYFCKQTLIIEKQRIWVIYPSEHAQQTITQKALEQCFIFCSSTQSLKQAYSSYLLLAFYYKQGRGMISIQNFILRVLYFRARQETEVSMVSRLVFCFSTLVFIQKSIITYNKPICIQCICMANDFTTKNVDSPLGMTIQ